MLISLYGYKSDDKSETLIMGRRLRLYLTQGRPLSADWFKHFLSQPFPSGISAQPKVMCRSVINPTIKATTIVLLRSYTSPALSSISRTIRSYQRAASLGFNGKSGPSNNLRRAIWNRSSDSTIWGTISRFASFWPSVQRNFLSNECPSDSLRSAGTACRK